MVRTTTHVLLAGLLLGACSTDRNENVKPPSKDAKGGDAKTDAPEADLDVEEVPDPGKDTSASPGDVGPKDASEAPPTVAGIYQGTHEVTVTATDGSTTFTGKAAMKVREDGVFSGTGTGSDSGNTKLVSLTMSGEVQGKDVVGTLVWTWVGPEAPGPATLTISGTVLGTTITAKLTGGDQLLTYQGTFTLQKSK